MKILPQRSIFSSWLGDAVWRGVAEQLDDLQRSLEPLDPSQFKFVCEAVIASYFSPHPQASDINERLGQLLFSGHHAALMLKNPRLCTLYSLPLTFLRTPPDCAADIAKLFLRLHAVGATGAPSYPSYRNVEMDYVAARLAGETWEKPSLAGFEFAFPWMTRDQCYSLTHLIFYGTDFGSRTVRYASKVIKMIELLIASAVESNDIDLSLELILCHSSLEGICQLRRQHHAAIAEQLVEQFKRTHFPVSKREDFHPFFVALMLEPQIDTVSFCGSIAKIMQREAAAMQAFGKGHPIAALAAYQDLLVADGPHEALDPVIDFYAPMVATSLEAVECGSDPHFAGCG